MLDAATSVDKSNASPEPGDVSICVECGFVMIFTESLALREPTQEERKRLAQDRELQELAKTVPRLWDKIRRSIN